MSQFSKLACLLSLAISASAGLIARDTAGASGLQRRAGDTNDYDQVFDGTGTGPTDRDAAIEGSGYLTFTTAASTLNECLHFCDLIQDCVFVNQYDEFNDPSAPQPVSKCSAYSVVHDADDKTNFGGQILGMGLDPTYMQESVGYALEIPPTPDTPDGYELAFGPINAQTSSPEALNSNDFETYDVQGCADLCTNQPADPTYGLCKFFNIYRFSDGVPTTFQCNVFALVSGEESTVEASGSIVRFSRGYTRTDFP
ncbi:hypothetical protein BDN72DRAFT_612386 [Pluteus cervinus]|uniref:Uncharacterized protein n=1 Tax=Pluteus cervinus TaxID=181527 RepID=A0ACD3AV10_9AGAR|nr:hypothetical protein BDN72DRAFT_612386 [Pluteus cervinus]